MKQTPKTENKKFVGTEEKRREEIIPRMDSRPLFLFLFYSFLLLSVSADPPSPSPSSDSDFIQSSCKLTLYPDLCYTSLSRFSSTLSHTPSQIALAAIAVCNSQSHFLSSYLSNLTRGGDIDHNSDYCFSALRDCSSTLSSAASQIRGSFKQITELIADGGAGESQIRFQISNVQTWMSAAITNEDTCTDGFDSVPDNSLKSDVCNRVAVVRKLTSNALALVNFYASTVG